MTFMQEVASGQREGQMPIDESMYQSAMEQPASDEAPVHVDRLSISDDHVLDLEDMYDLDNVSLSEGHATGPQWVWIAAGCCAVNPNTGPPAAWFAEEAPAAVSASNASLSGEPWRVDILQQLREKNEQTALNPSFSQYETPVERTSWTRKVNGARMQSESGR